MKTKQTVNIHTVKQNHKTRELITSRRTDRQATEKKGSEGGKDEEQLKKQQQQQQKQQQQKCTLLGKTTSRADYSVHPENWAQQTQRPHVQHKFKVGESEICPCNADIMTAAHLLQHCQLHDAFRRGM